MGEGESKRLMESVKIPSEEYPVMDGVLKNCRIVPSRQMFLKVRCSYNDFIRVGIILAYPLPLFPR